MFIKGKRVKAIAIVLTSVVYCAVVTAVCFGIILLCELLGGGNMLKTAAAIGVLCVLSFTALLFYSSLSVGEKAWYSGIADERKNYTRRLFFWFRPKNSFRALRFKVLLVTIKVMWAVVFFLPFAVLTWSIYYLSGSGGLELYLFISFGRSDSYGCVRRNILFYRHAKIFHCRISLLLRPEAQAAYRNKAKQKSA